MNVMTRENFCTLTEMKDGLTSPSRVSELVSNMQKGRETVVENVCDATRQWSTVATTLAATENRDCLDLFIQLDGLWFIHRWLNNALKLSNDPSQTSVDSLEDSVVTLVQALEKLPIDNEKSVSSGIWVTVENLLSHTSSKVRDRARALFGRWKQERDGNAHSQDVENRAAICEEELAVESAVPECSSGGCSDDEKHVRHTIDVMAVSVSSEALQPERFDDVPIQTSDGTNDCPISKEESTTYSSQETISANGSNPVVTEQTIIEGKSDTNEIIRSTADEVGVMENSSASSPLETGTVSSSADAENGRESLLDGHLQNYIDGKDDHFSLKALSLDDARRVLSQRRSESDGIGSPYQQGSERVCESDVLQDSSSSESISADGDNPVTSYSWREDYRGVDKVQDRHRDDDGKNLAIFSSLAIDTKDRAVISKRSDVEIDYIMVDAIEVARQVALEVEREVAESREDSSCGSSERISGSGIVQPNSPDSVDGREHEPIDGPPKEVPTGSSPLTAEPVISGENPDSETENCIQDMAQEPGGDETKGLCDFDLNQEICSGDIDPLGISISMPISVVSASRAIASPNLPVSPLQFEGALGWKGSATTSAFHPASARKNPDGDTSLSPGASSNSSKQQHHCLDFDLNVLEGEDDRVADLVPIKLVAVSSSGESAVGERLKLDLNRISDDGDCLSDWRIQDGHHIPSRSSSSLSKQPLMRNINLNDQPSSYNDFSYQPPHHCQSSSQNLNAFGGFKSGERTISIMGAKVEVNRKDFGGLNLSLPNGRISEPTIDFNLAPSGVVFGMGSTVPYAQSSPVFGCDGFTAGPSISLSSPIYGPGGPIPYMVDSRGPHFVPQTMGSASSVPHSLTRPSFFMSMAGSFLGSNGAGPSRPNLDLNYGSMIDGPNRDLGPGHVRLVDEQLRINLQPSSSSGVGGKRKEPDNGWELYPLNCKPRQ